MEDFYDLFFKECTQIFEICKTVEKELFPNLNGEDEHHKDTSVFLRKVEEKIGIEIDRNKQIFNEKRYHKHFCNNIAHKQIEKMNMFLNNSKVVEKEESENIRHYIYSINFMPVNADREKKIGLLLPCYNINRLKVIKNKKKEIQKYYSAKEMFRILSSYYSMDKKNKEKFFNTYIKFLTNRYIQVFKDKPIQSIRDTIDDMLKLIACEEINIKNMDSQDYRNSQKTPESELKLFYDNLCDGCYLDAQNSYYFFRHVLSEKDKKNMDKWFDILFFGKPISNEIKNNDTNEHKLFISDLQHIKKNNNINIQEEIIVNTIFVDQVTEDSRFVDLLEKHIETSQVRSINPEIVNTIKKDFIFKLLKEHFIWDDTIIANIKENIRKTYRDNRNELLFLRIDEYSEDEQRMIKKLNELGSKQKTIIDVQIVESLKEKFIEKFKTSDSKTIYIELKKPFQNDNGDFPMFAKKHPSELKYILQENIYISSKKQAFLEVVSLCLERLCNNIIKDSSIKDEKFKESVTEFLEGKINRINNLRREVSKTEKEEK